MKTYFQLLLFAVPFLAFQTALPAQSCYEKVRGDGLRMMDQKKYGEAIEQFFTAWVSCDDKPKDNDLDKLIKKAQRAWVTDLENQATREKEAKDALNKANTTLQETNNALEQAKLTADENARNAQVQGKKAESLRLVLLSANARQQGNYRNALLLAWMALQLAGKDASQAMKESFGDAVRDSEYKQIWNGASAVVKYRVVGTGDRILVETADFSAHLVDLKNQTNTRLNEAGAPYSGIAVNTTGTQFVIWNQNKAWVLDQQGHRLATLQGHTESIRTAAFSPDGNWLATGGRDNTARLWGMPTGQLAAVLSGHTGNIYDTGFSSDNRYIFTRSSDGTANLWDLSGKTIGASGPMLYAREVAFSGNILVGGGSNGWLYKVIPGLTDALTLGNQPIMEVEISKNQEYAGVLQADGIFSNIQLNAFKSVLTIKDRQISGFCLTPEGDGVWYWTATGALYYRQGETDRLLFSSQQPLANFQYSPDGQYFLCTAKDGTTTLFNQEFQPVMHLNTATDTMVFPSWSNDGKAIISVDKSGKSVIITPVPETVLEQLSQSRATKLDQMNNLAKQYDLQFWDDDLR